MPGGFDMNQLGAMLSQLGAMMSSATPSTGPVNYDLARKLAVQQLGSSHPVAGVDITKVRDAVALAEVWTEGATAFPAASRTVTAWTPREWVEQTMPAWEKLVAPIADRMGGALVETLPEEMRAQAGPMLGMLSQMGGMAFGSQLGAALSQLAGEVLTSTDIGLPLAPTGTAALMPRAVAEFGTSLGLEEDQVRLFLAAREVAHLRLYHGVPWLADKVVALVADYAAHITVDMSAAEELASSFDPSDMAALQQQLAQGMVAPEPTPAQQAIAQRLETLLALVEGWVDTVVGAAIGDRLPGGSALSETLRRRRATGGPAEQTFAALIGIELRPRKLRAAAGLWRDLGESRGVDGRDSLWSDYDLLPTSTDLDRPDEFVARDKQFNELLAGLGVDDLSAADFEDLPTTPDSDTDSGIDGPDGPARS
ncbi:zinc-dependent metalloprotease [Nakamurella deserti]|uniref:zinc-dependent metalloprotease n=1 Tax=Nakamurella deserti TaxID=2164074 RepID=UPI001F0BAFD4|nr:zinc-dependent metalloprotease [Nakamurella deserti]